LWLAKIPAQNEKVELEVIIAAHRDIRTRVSLGFKSEGAIISDSNFSLF
jgi:hypothetical protein